MSEWPEVRISELASIDIGGTPSRVVPSFWAEKPDGFPWLSIADMKGKFIDETKEHISALGVRASNVTLIPDHTTVMSFKLTVGRTAVVTREMYCNEAIAIFQPKDERLDTRWLYHALPGVARNVVTDTAVKGATLNKAKMAEMKVKLPSSIEQSKIAQILDTLDTAIAQTEAIIAKLKTVKKGLLHDLLTRGINANGELRPPQVDAPHLYKMSVLGWIPKEWEIRGVLDVASPARQCILTGPFGADLGTSDFKSDGVPLLRIGNVQAGFLEWSDLLFVSEQKAGLLAKYRVKAGDLLFARQGATTGRNALADERAEGALINYHIIRVAVDHERCHPHYLYAMFNSELAKAQVDQEKGRGTREGINSAQIAALVLALPPIAEQRGSVARMEALDDMLSQEKTGLDKLRKTKVGLMDDLLTGKVRVKTLVG